MSLKVDTDGLDELARNAHELSKQKEVSIYELMNNQFVSHHSKFGSLDELLAAAGIHNQQQFEEYPDEKLDKFIAENTDLSNWTSMQEDAMTSWLSKNLGF